MSYFNVRVRLPSLPDNIAGIADGIARFNKLGGGFEIGRFLDEFDWNNMPGVGSISVGDLNIRVLDDGKAGLFRKGERIDEGAIQRAMREGDLLRSIKEMKFDVDENVTKYAKEYQVKFKQSDGYLAGKQMDNFDHSSIPDPVGGETGFQAQLASNKALEARVMKRLDEMEAKVTPQGTLEVGKWLKRTVAVSAIIIGLAWLYTAVVEHQKLMNGCWLVNLTTSQETQTKCKLKALTCADADVTSVQVQQYMCRPYHEDIQCGQDSHTCFGPNICVAFNDQEECVHTLGEGCPSGLCHPACSQTADLIEVPSGYRLVCVEMSFWDALEDFVDETLDGGKSLIEWALTMGFVALALYVGFKVASSSSRRQQQSVAQ